MVLSHGGSDTTKNLDTPLEKRRRLCLSDDEVLQLGRWAVRIEENASARAGHPLPGSASTTRLVSTTPRDLSVS